MKAFWFALVLVSSAALSGEIRKVSPESTSSNPDGQVEFGNSEYLFRFEAKPQQGSARLTPLRSKGNLPSELTLSLQNADGTFTTISLKAMDPPLGAGPMPTYQGKLDSSAQSFVGLELKFAPGSGSKTLRWKR